MSRAERFLVLLLRLEAAVLLCALPAVVMPTAWMAGIHQGLGMGTLPQGPLVEYLTRSLSLLYAAWAPVLFVLAGDLQRYLPLVKIVNAVRLVFGVALLLLDVRVGMPLVWTWSEGPIVIVLSVVGLLLVGAVQRERR